uniref:Uncharacterized protein n=1 Tax=Helianthus annuus TaxID=4232 RepID=A0A251VBS6_HELAN
MWFGSFCKFSSNSTGLTLSIISVNEKGNSKTIFKLQLYKIKDKDLRNDSL